MKFTVRERKRSDRSSGSRRTWQVDLMVGALRKRVTHPGPRDDARRWGALALAALAEGKPLPPIKEEVVTPEPVAARKADAMRPLVDVWREFESAILKAHRPNTKRLREKQWQWLEPTLGHVPISKINPAMLKALAATLQTRKGARRKKGLGPRTVRETVKFAVRLLRHAVDLEWLDHAPSTPRIATPASDLPVWTLDEADLVLEAMPEGIIRTMFLVLLRTGLRVSELRGLQWGDIDFARSTLKVDRQLSDMDEVGPPKHNHRRAVYVPADALEALKELPKRGVFVFDRGGKEGVLSRQKLGRKIAQACKVAGVRVGTNHAARRTLATGAARLGIGTLAIAEQLGHTRVSTTDTYIRRFGATPSAEFERLADWHPKQAKTGTQEGGASESTTKRG